MAKWLILFGLILAGCNTDSEDGGSISPGTYQTKRQFPGAEALLQVDLDASGTYTAKGYIKTSDGAMDCQLFDATGKWAVVDDHFKISEAKARDRDACDSEFSQWESRPESSEELRNITATSFEVYEEGDADTPAEWVKYTKL